jgi:hypothetical protein
MTTNDQPLYVKEIVYDRETHDYAAYLDGELVGFGRTYLEAETLLDSLVLELCKTGYFREAD